MVAVGCVYLADIALIGVPSFPPACSISILARTDDAVCKAVPSDIPISVLLLFCVMPVRPEVSLNILLVFALESSTGRVPLFFIYKKSMRFAHERKTING